MIHILECKNTLISGIDIGVESDSTHGSKLDVCICCSTAAVQDKQSAHASKAWKREMCKCFEAPESILITISFFRDSAPTTHAEGAYMDVTTRLFMSNARMPMRACCDGSAPIPTRRLIFYFGVTTRSREYGGTTALTSLAPSLPTCSTHHINASLDTTLYGLN